MELDALLTRVDRFFIDQDMADLTVDIDVYRDPSNRLNDRNIREGDPSDIAGLTTLISHYAYTWPDYYELMVMGEMLAGSELPADTSFFSQMLPLPGAPIYTEDLRARFRIRFMGTDEVDGVPVYKVRYTAVDRDTEFFNYIDYFIGIGREVILRVESTFESPWYYGNAGGDFYYDEWLGKYLPIYGHGSVLYYPNHSSDVWGRWYNWDWKSAEEAAADSGEPVPEDENSGSVSE
ncbi:MAG: hypothetical protein NTY09_01640 [bacterium]|nr:hypothetical protein [bacterium]